MHHDNLHKNEDQICTYHFAFGDLSGIGTTVHIQQAQHQIIKEKCSKTLSLHKKRLRMYALERLRSYLHYQLLSWHANGHGVHSPYLFDMVRQCFIPAREEEPFIWIEEHRRQLSRDRTKIAVTDRGAGSKKLGQTRKVCDIANCSAVAPKYGRLLAHLVQWSGASSVLELGSSVGLGSMYLSHFLEGKLVSIDACPETVAFARSQHTKWSNKDVNFLEGEFTKILPALHEASMKFDLVYIDGNHTYQGTMENFQLLHPLTHQESILVFDDIYWSEGMREAWHEIRRHPSVTASVDIWQMGIVFMRPELSKEQFCIRY